MMAWTFLSRFFVLCLIASFSHYSMAVEEFFPKGAKFGVRICRLGCFGTCPAYCYSLSADGVVDFDPTGNTKSKIRRRFRVTQQAIERVKIHLERAWIFDRKPEYEYGGEVCKRYETDHQIFSIAATMDGRVVDLTVDEGCGEVDHVLIELPGVLEQVLGLKKHIR